MSHLHTARGCASLQAKPEWVDRRGPHAAHAVQALGVDGPTKQARGEAARLLEAG
ncbi:MAG: hypothetical protein M3024_03225 [Candidatus Dormibacteraeota bacterium]|nr:hypothetical protein [Candidatus Dormibacteraeota bacterium]